MNYEDNEIMNNSSEALTIFLSNLTQDELMLGLGENLPDELGFDETVTPEQKISAGLNWWSANAPDIKKTVCSVACNNEANSAVVKDIVQIAFTLLGAKYGMAIATYAAVIAARQVINGWCKEE